jgi:hypothetical protein
MGKCDICKSENVVIQREYYHYDIKCECHSPKHFEIVFYCSNCKPVEPKETRIHLQTKDLPRLI